MFSSLSNTVQTILSQQFAICDVTVPWERPQGSEYGDIATPIALQIAKKANKSPKDIANTLVQFLLQEETVERAEVAGPGYVNIWLTASALIEALGSVRSACTAKVHNGKDAPVIVEYSQPNIAKPLGAHHLLTTLIGQSIANIYEHLGYNVMKWNYMGDWGTQFGKLAVAVEQWGDIAKISLYSVDDLLSYYVKFHEEVENDPTLEDRAREAFKALEDGDSEIRKFWETVVGTTKSALATLYAQLNVSFDTDISESFYQDKMQSILQEGKKKNVFVEGEGGSLIVRFPDDSNLPPYLVQKADGATLYATRDIAQMRYRIDQYHPQEILIVTDIAQKLHFEQLEATCEQLEWTLPVFENVVSGRMRFADKSMSTRKGNVLKLEEVLQEAVIRAEQKIIEHGDAIQADDTQALAKMLGVGALAYGILSQNRKQDIIFDWEKMLSFEGNSAPYLQYTHARARSIVSKAGTATSMPDGIESFTEKERQLLNTLLQFGQALEDARMNHMPHTLANYLYALCKDYNAFYNDDTILQAKEPTRTFRIHLTNLTADVLKTGAALLTISVPDRM